MLQSFNPNLELLKKGIACVGTLRRIWKEYIEETFSMSYEEKLRAIMLV